MTEYEAVLDEIYSSFKAAKQLVEGRHDRDVRDPQRTLKIAIKLGILPDPERTIRITGSKGKGTTARLSAAALGAARPGAKVGLFVSPEELEHVDRMRINGRPIKHKNFIRIQRLVAKAFADFPPGSKNANYISPVGYFLLIALFWFAEEGVDMTVLECGRGAEYDEVGQIPSKVAVVTSILFEHPRQLGPTIQDIAANKFAIARQSKTTITSVQASEFAFSLATMPSNLRIITAKTSSAGLPAWIMEDDALARAASKALLCLTEEHAESLTYPIDSASYGRALRGRLEIVFEAAISADSLDLDYLRRLAAGSGRVHVITSLPDDKDRAQMLTMLTDIFGQVHEVALTGTRGYLHYAEAMKHDTTREIGQLEHHQLNGIVKSLETSSSDVVYFVGTQTFIRLVKNWLQASSPKK